jgi:hypothetical protein
MSEMSESGSKSVEAAVEPQNLAGNFSARTGMLGLVIVACVFNLLALPVVRGIESRGPFYASTGIHSNILMLVVMPVIVGVLAGEIGAMACWLVWAEGLFWQRLVVHWAAGLVMVACVLCGWLVATLDIGQQLRPGVLQAAAWIFCVVPGASLAVQLPMWPFRTHLGWHVAQTNSQTQMSPQPLSILDILIGTAVVAVSLGLIRFVPGGSTQYVMLQMGNTGLALAVTSLVVLIPATILVLRMSSGPLGVVVYLGGVFLSMAAFIVITSSISGRWPPVDGIFAMLWGSQVFAGTAGAPLFVWRGCGYRLVRARDRKKM